MRIYYPDLQRHSFFRPPDWRWRRAQWLVARGRYFSRRRDDEDTGRAVHYLRALARCRPGTAGAAAAKQFADVHAACRLHEAGGQIALLVQARLLARQATPEVARLTGVPPEVVDTYEALFFHCRDCLDARDWVSVQAIGREACPRATEPDPGAVLKLFACHGGPLVLDAVLPYLVGGKDLFDPPLDLSTLEGRQEQSVRLAVAAHLLPRAATTDNKLHRIMLILLERERQRGVRRPQATLLAEKLDSRLAELPTDAPKEQATEEERPCPATVARALRQPA